MAGIQRFFEIILLAFRYSFVPEKNVSDPYVTKICFCNRKSNDFDIQPNLHVQGREKRFVNLAKHDLGRARQNR